MDDSELRLNRELTEHLLGLLDETERAEVQARVDADPALQRKAQRLQALLASLDAWEAPLPPADLATRIVDRASATTPLDYVAATATVAPAAVAGGGRRSSYTLGQFAAMAACIALIFAGLFPTIFGLKGRRLESACTQNMASLGRGLQTYAAANNGAMPAVAVPPGANWMILPNRHHLMPAIRLRFIAPSSLVCPTTPLDNRDTTDDQSIDAMLSDPTISLRFYSPQNMQGPVVRITSRISMPIASDPNPVFDGGRFQLQVGWTANSTAHNGRGQNVLFDDGACRFLTSPYYGAQSDNIWRAEHVDQYSGTEAQESATDAFLTP